MIDSSKHTKTFLESRSKFQCYYNNVGYCKYREKCHYQHFTKICELRLCRDTFCKFRHPRTCKHGAKCRFLQRQCCLYNHKTSDPNKIEESATLEKEVKELKSDVSTLTKVLEDKEQKLQELSEMIANQNEKILELKAENSNLKSNLDKISSCEECKFISKMQNDLVAHQLSEHEKTENFACTKCEYNSKKENDLKLHISTNHPVYPSNKCVFQKEGNQIVKKNKRH